MLQYVGAPVVVRREVAAEREHVEPRHESAVPCLDIDAVDGAVAGGGHDGVLIDPDRAALAGMRGAQALIDRHRSGVIEVYDAEVTIPGQVEATPGEPHRVPDASPEIDRVPFLLSQPVAKTGQGDGHAELHPRCLLVVKDPLLPVGSEQ